MIIIFSFAYLPNYSTKLQVPVPVVIRIINNFTSFFKRAWSFILFFVLIFILGIRFILKKPNIKKAIDQFKTKIPIYQRFLISSLTSKLSRALSILLQASVNLTDSFPIVIPLMANSYIESKLHSAFNEILKGTSFSQALKDANLFRSDFLEMVKVGEQSGELGSMLSTTTAYLDEQVLDNMHKLVALIEPSLIVLIAGLIIIIMSVVFFPYEYHEIPLIRKQKMTFNHVLANRLISYSPMLRKKAKQFLEQLPKEAKPSRFDYELLNQQLISEEDLLKIIASIWNIPIYDETKHNLDATLLKKFSMDFIIKNQILPLCFCNGKYWIAITDWFYLFIHQKLICLFDKPYQPVLMTKKVWEGICQMLFSHRETLLLLNNMEQDTPIIDRENDEENQEIDTAPIVQLVDAIIKEAISIGASDIHFEPMERNVRVRMRIDGILVKKANLNHKIYSSLLTRIKIASNIDITKRRIPQDGRMKYLENIRI